MVSCRISGVVGQLWHSGSGGGCSVRREAASSATLSARSTAVLSGEDRVGVFREPCGVKVGDTASSNIRVARSILCSRERDDVNWIVDKSSRLSPTRSGHRSVIIAIYMNRVRGWVRTASGCLYRFESM